MTEQGYPIPPRQQPYQQAFALGFDALISRRPTDRKLEALGAERVSGVVHLPALSQVLIVDSIKREVLVEKRGNARIAWAILALHYLCADDLSLDTQEVSLKHFPDCRGYCSVFEKRILQRFLATSGRTREQFEQASEQLNAIRVSHPAVAYRFNVLPRIPITVVRYDGDEELGPNATVLYRADAEHLLHAEDRIVAAELLLDMLSGKPMEERPEAST